MPRYGVGVSFEFDADDDDNSQEVADQIVAYINKHEAVFPRSVNQIDGWPECLEGCLEEEASDDQSEEG